MIRFDNFMKVFALVWTWGWIVFGVGAGGWLVYKSIHVAKLNTTCNTLCKRSVGYIGEAVPQMKYDVCVCWPEKGQPIYMLDKGDK